MLAFVLLIAIGFGGYGFYKKWEARRLVGRARTYLSWGDSKSAALTVRRAYQLDAANVEACRLLAQVAEREGQPAAVEWRQQVTTLQPGSVPDLIALGRAAIQFNRIDTAEAALAKIGSAGDQSADFHEVMAQLAIAKKDPASAEKYYAEAVRLDPSRQQDQLNLAVFQLQSNSRETRDRASERLQQFMNDKMLRVPAARALRDYAAQRKDGPALLDITELLYGYPEATFRDRLSYLQVLQALGHPEFAAKLTELQNEALKDTDKLTTLIAWMSSNHLAVLAIDWSKRWPQEVLDNKIVRTSIAECYVSANDAAGLQQWCQSPSWGSLEFLRHAYLAWAARSTGDNFTFQSEWNNAVRDAGSNGNELFSLQQNAAKWKWREQAESVLWALTKDNEKQMPALASLSQYYTEKGDTAQLYRVAARLTEMDPNDAVAKNNLANISLLLNLNTDSAETMAAELYHKQPDNPAYASTYAFALYRTAGVQPALEVMNKLKPADLAQPSIAAYYGVFLAAAGDKAGAAEYLKKSEDARLLPEEKALVKRARDSLVESH